MLLAVDIGNTNIDLGVFEGQELRATWRFATDVERVADEYAAALITLLRADGLELSGVKAAVMCSGVPELAPVFDQVCRRYFDTQPVVVGPGTHTGVRILYDNPREVGPDRVVDVVAALRLHGPPPLIIVDIGTATVFDAVSAQGDYLGGAIAPGMGLAAEALFQRAAKLYRVELVAPQNAIGRNTTAAMQSGIVWGYVSLVEGMVSRFQKELGGGARVIATGGWSKLIAAGTSVFDRIDMNLTLSGLRIVYDMNRGEAG
jgi:type III pantothenate kinase